MFGEFLKQFNRTDLEYFVTVLAPIVGIIAGTLMAFAAYHKLRRTAVVLWTIMFVAIVPIANVAYFLIHNV